MCPKTVPQVINSHAVYIQYKYTAGCVVVEKY